MIDRDRSVAGNALECIQTDHAISFEQHFIAAYLVAMERCNVVQHNMRHLESKHPDIVTVGYSSATHRYIGCDVLDWMDTWWPLEMNRTKVLPKLQERVRLFRAMIPLKDSLRNEHADAKPQTRYIFFSFSSPSDRIRRVLQSIGNDAGVHIFSAVQVKNLAKALAGFFASTDLLPDNHFARAVRLLADEKRETVEAADVRTVKQKPSGGIQN